MDGLVATVVQQYLAQVFVAHLVGLLLEKARHGQRDGSEAVQRVGNVVGRPDRTLVSSGRRSRRRRGKARRGARAADRRQGRSLAGGSRTLEIASL